MADRDAQAPDLNGILSKLQELEARCQRYEGEIQQKDAKLQAFTVNKSKVHLSLFVVCTACAIMSTLKKNVPVSRRCVLS